MNFGHCSTDNTIEVPSQIISYPDPLIAGMQRSTSSSEQLFEPLQSSTSTNQQVLAIQRDFEKMNFGRKNLGHSSVVNTIVEQAQKEPHSGPSMANMQSSTSALKQLPDPLKCAASSEQQISVIQRDLEKMNFGTENSGNGSTENTMVESAEMVKFSAAVRATLQREKSNFVEMLKSVTSAEHLVAIQKAYPHLMAVVIKRRIAHYQLALEQQAKQLVQIEGSKTKNHTMGQQVLNLDSSILDGMQKNTSTLKFLYDSLSTVSAHQQQQAQAILEANPNLKTAFINFKKKLQREQQNQSLQAVLNESSIIENHTVGPQEVLPNPDPTEVDMQSLTSTSVQLLETLPTVSGQQQQQDLTALDTPELRALKLAKRIQQQIKVLNNCQLILRERKLLKQQQQPLQQELPQLLDRQQRRLHQRKQRRQMLVEHDIAGYSRRSSGRVVQNQDPSETMQNLSELWPQLIESLADLNLE